jgi:electron transfer flavoprotein alpha/beta subunit
VIVLVCLESPSPGRASRAALDLACALPAPAQVVALSAGGPSQTPSLEMACACAARVLHLDDPTLDKADFLTMGMVLAEAARHVEAGIVLTGEHSDDEGQGLVPAALAHHLHAPILSHVQVVTFPEGKADSVEVTVRAGGRICRIESPLPLVLSTSPTAASLPGLNVGAVAASVETLTLAQLGLDSSRMVPRPDLLGGMVATPAESLPGHR